MNKRQVFYLKAKLDLLLEIESLLFSLVDFVRGRRFKVVQKLSKNYKPDTLTPNNEHGNENILEIDRVPKGEPEQ